MSAGKKAELLLQEAARALEAADPVAASGAIERALEHLANGPALDDAELLIFAHARLLAYAGGEAARLEEELARLDDLHPYARSSVRSRATA